PDRAAFWQLEPAIPDFSWWQIAYCAVAIVACYALRGSTGFGAAAAMPLLALVVPLKVVVAVGRVLGLSSSIAIVAHTWREVAVRDLLRTLPTGLIGVAIGLYLFKSLDARLLGRGLGLLVIAYGLYVLWTLARPQARWQPSPRLFAPIAGILGGAVGTTFGTMASIFYAIYFDAIQLAKERFRATMSAMILTLSVARGLGYAAVGEFGLDVLILFAAAFPLMLIGIYIGDRFHAGMSETTFRLLVGLVLIASGAALL